MNMKPASNQFSREITRNHEQPTGKGKLHLDTRKRLRSGVVKPSEVSLKHQLAEAWHHRIVSARPGYWNLWCRLSLKMSKSNHEGDDGFSSPNALIDPYMNVFLCA